MRTEHYNTGLTIHEIGDHLFVVENDFMRLEGYCRAIDQYRTTARLDKNYTKGKNGRLYLSKKLFDHNQTWFSWILEEHGFVRKSIPYPEYE